MLRSTTQGHGPSEVARGEQIVKNKKSSHASFVQEDVLGGHGSGVHEEGGVRVLNKSFILIICCLLT